jgi:predicted amidohydrolase
MQGADIIVFPECGLSTIHLPESRHEIRSLLTPIPDPVQRQIPCAASAGDVPEVSSAGRAANVLVYVCGVATLELEIQMRRIGELVYFLGIVFQLKEERLQHASLAD